VIRRPEAATFAAVADAVVAPEAPLPPVAATDAVAAFAALLEASPAPNRYALRALLRALELAPLALGGRRRLSALGRAERLALLTRLQAHAPTSGAVTALRSVAHLCYYGDAGVLALIGYDPAAVVARGRALREAEGRW
jgi:hypothetical protein